MSITTSPPSLASDSFACECDSFMRSACCREILDVEHDGKRYCVLHYPGTEKRKVFQRALQQKLNDEDFNFQGVWFTDEVFFENLTFSKKADFRRAVFSRTAYFSLARFSTDAFFDGAQFDKKADFRGAQFGGKVSFRGAQFNADAYFSGAQIYQKASFVSVSFNANAYFGGLSIIGGEGSNTQGAISSAGAVDEDKLVDINFKGANFKEVARFKENKFTEPTCLRFANAIFDKPERAVFHNTAVRPHWFINVDSRKFTFINVDWGYLDIRAAVRKEIAALERSAAGDLSDLETTFRQLAVNGEENNRYEEAADFRYMAMETRRLQRRRKVDLFRLSWWYWLLSGYGERVQRALGALAVIWLFFAVVYWTGNATWWQPKQAARVAAESSEPKQQTAATPLTLTEALIYSAGVMTLQKPEPLPANKRAKACVLLETILGPVQAALLALAIRRKFMR